MIHITILASITDLKQSLKPKRKKKNFQMLIFIKKITAVPSLRTYVSYTVLKSLLNFFHFCCRLNAESYLFLESSKDKILQHKKIMSNT